MLLSKIEGVLAVVLKSGKSDMTLAVYSLRKNTEELVTSVKVAGGFKVKQAILTILTVITSVSLLVLLTQGHPSLKSEKINKVESNSVDIVRFILLGTP